MTDCFTVHGSKKWMENFYSHHQCQQDWHSGFPIKPSVLICAVSRAHFFVNSSFHWVKDPQADVCLLPARLREAAFACLWMTMVLPLTPLSDPLSPIKHLNLLSAQIESSYRRDLIKREGRLLRDERMCGVLSFLSHSICCVKVWNEKSVRHRYWQTDRQNTNRQEHGGVTPCRTEREAVSWHVEG